MADSPALPQMRAVKRRMRRKALRRGMAVLPILILAALVLAAALLVPVLQIFGDSMSPTLCDGDIVLLHREERYCPGQIVAFDCDGQLLVRRIIAGPGSTVSIDLSGQVTVDGSILPESYAPDPALGICDVKFPLTVPVGHYFVLADQRSGTLDSRCELVGTVSCDSILGRVIHRLLPWSTF